MRKQVVFMLATIVVVNLCTVVRSYGASQRWLSIGDSEISVPVQVSVDQTLLKSEPKIVVTTQGAFESRIDAPDGRHYSQLSIPGCGAGAKEIGHPEMPFKGFFIEIPYGVDVEINILDTSTVSLGTGFRIYPLQPPQVDEGGVKPVFEINQQVYATDSLFPETPIVIDEPGFIRGRRVIFVQVFPLQYNPGSTELRVFSSLRFKLRFKETPEKNKNGQARKKQLATNVSESLAQTLIINYEGLEDIAGGTELEILDTGNGVDYLIIVADGLYEEVLGLAEWKRKKGFLTKITTMSEVGSTANNVKAYIQNAYDNWSPAPSYVLLVGDSEDIPSLYYSAGGLSCITDQLYACVDGSDYYPDLTIGRLPVHTEDECVVVVDKILTYDRTPDLGNWYNHFLSAAYFQDEDCNGVADRWFMETAAHLTEFLESNVGMTKHTTWVTTPWCDPHSSYHYREKDYPHRFPYPDPVPDWVISQWTDPEEISRTINAGVGLVQHWDHGGETYWVYPYYAVEYIKYFSNGLMTPVVFSPGCLTGAFHRSGGDCFCEAFLKKSNGGCVGIVGATTMSLLGYTDLLIHGMYTCFWPSYDSSHTDNTYPHSWRSAEALNYGKYYMLIYEGSYTTTIAQFNMFHWFGDPEMMLRTKTPQALSVFYDSNIVFGMPVDVTVDVNQSSTPLEGALVAITHPTIEQDYWTGFTDANGSVMFPDIVFSQCGDYDIVVTGHNCIPYEGVIRSCPLSDFDDDCDTDFYDFAVLGWQWLQTPGEPSADIAPDSGDNMVNTLDLAILAENWLVGVE